MRELSDIRRNNIDSCCDRFEAAWKSTARPNLAEYLEECSGPERETLFRYLLELDVDYRKRWGEPVAAADYRDAFAEFDSIIAEVLSKDSDTVSLQKVGTRP